MADSVGILLERCIEQLNQAGIADADISARLIIQNHLNKTPVQLQMAYADPVNSELTQRIKSDIARRSEHYPLQYILGEIEFFNIRLKVDERVLIPRPETEILVEQAIGAAKKYSTPRILDIGTGSGNISIALATELPNAKIKAVDISEKAIGLARQNAVLNAVDDKIEFIKNDCLDSAFYRGAGKFDIVVSNPPYVNETDFEFLQPEVKLHEPKIALVAEKDVLKYYRAISAGLSAILIPGGFVIVEIGRGQAHLVSDIFIKENPTIKIRIVNDLNSIPRIVIGELPL
jgi:release factor glutamine methyltransferase